LTQLSNVKYIICVASGKGGVGKSTTAVNLALALLKLGHSTGLLDADIYGPSQPLMLGVEKGTRPKIKDQKYMEPVLAHGLQCNSMGFLIDENTPMVWRAPMIISAFKQILTDTLWSDIEYLIVDMPPGTGDIQLSLAQLVNVTGAVIVTTPQDVALLDARKGIEMFRKVEIPILGVVENMSTHICSQCGHEEAIFGSGGGELLSRDYGASLIGSLPLDLSIRAQTDAGNPVVVSDPDSGVAKAYIKLATNLVNVVIEKSESAGNSPIITVTDD
jgi:ATP-binding protein involved in chromosome partitioning